MSKALRNYNKNAYLDDEVTTKSNERQVKNNTGGFVFQVENKSRLERFLILGVDGGTYYVSERDLTKQNVEWLIKFIKEAPGVVLNTILDVSSSGRSYRNGAALFALALMLNHADDVFKGMAVDAAPSIARTATHVYELAQYIENLGGWGRAKRRAVAKWFTSKTPDQLAYQAVKFRQRNGWTLRDLMRLSHPVGVNPEVGNFILGKPTSTLDQGILTGFTAMQQATNEKSVLALLEIYRNLPWETIPTQFLKSPEVWKKLFYNGSLQGQALLRNIVRLSRIGAFSDIVFAGDYAKKLLDEEMIRKTRLHPVQYLLASITYEEGQTERSAYSYGEPSRKKDWTTNPKIAHALTQGFKLAFKTITPSGKRFRLGVDVSGSMSWSSVIGADVTAAQGSAAMALITASAEDYVEILGFSNTLKDLGIHGGMNFSQVKQKVQMHNFGSTDASLLINDARLSRTKIDTFVVITDNEVNTGTHPSNALRKYRDEMGIDAKLVVMGMTATDFTIADPNDRGMLDVVGFDSNAPKVVSEFAAGRL
jgi:60 kDa SS-A/Ro ribonucleoprotein